MTPKHRTTDPACTFHQVPVTKAELRRFDRARGRACQVCLADATAELEAGPEGPCQDWPLCGHQDGRCWARPVAYDELTASAPTELTLAAVPAQVDLTRRTISGVLIPAGDVLGSTSAGPTRFAHGSITWSEPRRVKLLREHQHADSLGHFIHLAWDPSQGLVGTAWLPPSDDPQEEASRLRALADARDGVRDGLSVGTTQLVASYATDGVLEVTGGLLREGSLVSVPAFDGSRVLAVVASSTTTERQAVFTPDELAALRIAGIDSSDTTRARQFLDGLTASAQATPPAAPAPIQGPAPVTELRASDIIDELQERFRSGAFTFTPDPVTHAQPGQLTGQSRQGLELSAFAELVAERYATGNTPDGLRAALTDVIPSQHPAAFRPAYLDELWDGTDYQRKFIDNATTKRPLPRAMKIIGHRWVAGKAPQVGDYAGDKAAVPSNATQMEDIEVPVARMAGAYDVDRAFIDLGSPEWLAAYFEAQTEDYRKKSDAKAAAAAFAGATQLTDTDATPLTFPTLLKGVTAGVVAMATVGEGVEYVAMAPGLIAELLGITTADAPAFFGGSFQLNASGDGALGGTTWFTTPGLSGSQFLVGNRRGMRWHEQEPPIKVQAVNVANGGVDLGVFGYYATYVRNAAQIRKATVGA